MIAAAALTTEHKIIRDLDAAWSDRLRLEARIIDDRFCSYEDRYNSHSYLECARRAIDARRKELDALRADRAATAARVEHLTATATTAGDPLLTALGYLAHGAAILTPA